MSIAPALTFAQRLRPFKALSGPREVIRQFTPNWFAATMGTGILALALAQLPWRAPGLVAAGERLWICNVALFAVFALLYAARWALYFDQARRIFAHASASMFLGTIPMGLATVINGLLLYGVPRWGSAVLPLAETLWWVDVAMALACGVGVPYLMFTRQQHRIEQMTAVWLLPVVAAEVAAASGGLLAPHLADAGMRFAVLIASYALWAYSVPVAMSILVILLLRMALHQLPPASMAASSWLSLGPIATGALGMLAMGADAPAIFAAHGLADLGQIAAGIGVIGGLLFWGLGAWWLLLSVLITARYFRAEVPFNLGWWGFTFPLGVYALATLKLGALLQLMFFSTLGVALVAVLGVVWAVVATKTLAGAYRGHLFVSPCIAEIQSGPPRVEA
ncbi:TDT family transporter [Xanthomonas vesicatoria]|uniref:TDT family transporter n=2 Tax=Xanthomonas vesicatoria TaxID=56460 RepID=A0ABS8LFE0_9XANT|nr:TDT family transporter [Xanthomonas vesicatoria]APO95125.1 C4-dicarboxylate ABC transporter [Xanthomonas vesicatoria]APP75297.1 C4-dicarboxylate ABC transporter [Xanthomonas vesicatoria ATCC 35937]EGD09133.1 tellurite resistance protein-like permease [Xanthomonas vesicatoria ATCC 35937]MCC8558851.1 TDT family transporter [Xanthomonas vesicatoria]MCC8596456.1 TDT family transporter [Xanthomonas vesicatoria]